MQGEGRDQVEEVGVKAHEHDNCDQYQRIGSEVRLALRIQDKEGWWHAYDMQMQIQGCTAFIDCLLDCLKSHGIEFI